MISNTLAHGPNLRAAGVELQFLAGNDMQGRRVVYVGCPNFGREERKQRVRWASQGGASLGGASFSDTLRVPPSEGGARTLEKRFTLSHLTSNQNQGERSGAAAPHGFCSERPGRYIVHCISGLAERSSFGKPERNDLRPLRAFFMRAWGDRCQRRQRCQQIPVAFDRVSQPVKRQSRLSM